jgi:hypothetical protein
MRADLCEAVIEYADGMYRHLDAMLHETKRVMKTRVSGDVIASCISCRIPYNTKTPPDTLLKCYRCERVYHCGRSFCEGPFDIVNCVECGKIMCLDCLCTCRRCSVSMCQACLTRCLFCNYYNCKKDSHTCDVCGTTMCGYCWDVKKGCRECWMRKGIAAVLKSRLYDSPDISK